MRDASKHPQAGFTLVELTIVVVISTIALIAIYQTLITQERTYRYQSAAIDAQASTRIGLQLLGAELREISASAGVTPLTTGGSDLLVATSDSIRFRAFRKVGIACAINRVNGTIDAWVPGSQFEDSDTVFLFQEGDTLTDQDDTWAGGVSIGSVGTSSTPSCATELATYPTQGIRVNLLFVQTMERGALIRSYNTLTYGAYRWDDEWVLGRRNPDGEVIPLVGPLLAPDSGGIAFRYFDINNQLLNPNNAARRAAVSRVEITVRALSRGGIDHQNYVDSLSTNVYLRGN